MRAMYPDSHTHSLRLDQAVGKVDIATMWDEHYTDTLNSVRDYGADSALWGEVCEVRLGGFCSMDHSKLREQ